MGNDIKNKHKIIWLLAPFYNICAILLFSFLISNIAYADTPTLAQVLKNIAGTTESLMRLVTALTYVMGFFLVVRGVMSLKQYGESRTMMTSQHELTGPMAKLFAGAALIYLPNSVNVGISTFWGTATIYAYVPQSKDPWADLIQSCFQIIQLIGVIAFFRGMVLFTHLGSQHGHQQNTFGKALSHVVGGILCINMYAFINIMLNTLSLGIK